MIISNLPVGIDKKVILYTQNKKPKISQFLVHLINHNLTHTDEANVPADSYIN